MSAKGKQQLGRTPTLLKNHFIFSGGARAIRRQFPDATLPTQLDSSYFGGVRVGDVVWVVERILVDDALVRARFEVASVNPGKNRRITLLRKGRSTTSFRHLSLKAGRIRLEFSSAPGPLAGWTECEGVGAELSFKGRMCRGFRTGWQLTPKSAAELESLWSGPDNSEQPLNDMGAGFSRSEENCEVECAAIEVVTGLFEADGFEVHSVESDRLGYDLRCCKGRNELHVEVKGVKGSREKVILTAGELKSARTDPKFMLYVVLDALQEQCEVRYYTGSSVLKDFEIDPLAYMLTRKV